MKGLAITSLACYENKVNDQGTVAIGHDDTQK